MACFTSGRGPLPVVNDFEYVILEVTVPEKLSDSILVLVAEREVR
jgi:hypothetical protein